MDWKNMIPTDLQDKYEFHNINHAVEILKNAYPELLNEIFDALRKWGITEADLLMGGGNESPIPKKLSQTLHPLGWEEVKIDGDLLVHLKGRTSGRKETIQINGFIDGHNIDYVNGEVAVDMEWNSKDQTFDRDLYAFRTFYECGIIKCGAIITRSEELNFLFDRLGIKKKYGASTTWMGKLLPRIHSGRHGGCPLMLVGIRPAAIEQNEEI